MKNYEVRLANRIENSGLDSEVFATKLEAQRAAKIVTEMYSAKPYEVGVCETSKPVTITFAEWNSKGW